MICPLQLIVELIHVDNLFYKLFNNNSHQNVRPLSLFTKTTNEKIFNKINIILS